jgi:alpha/beta superfamily hydrolase
MTPRDIDTLPPERLLIDGPTGTLAATLEVPTATNRAVVLLLHPHSEHGGSRRNNVVRYGALGALESGCAALRIDFRGAGDSAGEYDNGIGEVDDAAAAAAWLRGRFPGLPLFVWGFSFGSRVGLELCDRLRDNCAGYMAVAWPSKLYSWPEIGHWPQRMSFIAGEEDDIIDFSNMKPVSEHGAALVKVAGADHFFSGMLGEVRKFTADALSGWVN